MKLKVTPIDDLKGRCRIPSSKPETQRAILAASLADGTSIIRNDLRCSETDTMKKACRKIGAVIHEHEDHLEIHGISNQLDYPGKIIDCLGSGLVFRLFMSLTSFSKHPLIITGDEVLRNRPVSPLYRALRSLGANISSILDDDKGPFVNWGNGGLSGKCTLPGDVSSQFITALLFAAPFTKDFVEIELTGEILSQSYINQSLAMLELAGINFKVEQDGRNITVYSSKYKAFSLELLGDYTSASYLFAAGAICQSELTLENIDGDSLQGERAIIPILQEIGVEVTCDKEKSEVRIRNDNPPSGHFEFDVSDCPNITPTLAAIGAYVQGSFRVTGASITRLHKSSRVEAMICELKKAHVDISPIYKGDGVIDGFEIKGKHYYPGLNTFSHWGDHRIFMSLFVFSLRSKDYNYLSGYHEVGLSFASFLTEFNKLGATFSEMQEEEESLCG